MVRGRGVEERGGEGRALLLSCVNSDSAYQRISTFSVTTRFKIAICSWAKNLQVAVFSLHILRYYVIHFSCIVYYMSPDNRINSKMTGIYESALFMHGNYDLNIIAPQNCLLNELLGP